MYEGWTVPIDYDPLLAKLIGYGSDREQAISRLVRALNEYFVGGIKTNLSLFRRILRDPEFHAGNVDTGYLDRLLKTPPPEVKKEDTEVAAIAAGIFAMLEPVPGGNDKGTNGSAKKVATGNSWKQAARVEALRR
jgi:acetyl-CoA carboxylase biotin carboxylase subunit